MRNTKKFSCLYLPLLLCSAISAPTFASTLDPISAECMSCHDGTSAWRVKYCLLEQMGKGCGGHIVSADYAAIAARDKDLRPPKDLPSYIYFYEGKITCVTCHGTDPHSGQMMVIDNTGSVLCRTCHLK